MDTCDLQETLSRLCNLQVKLSFNKNRSTIINILERKNNLVRLSIHEMFDKAALPITHALADFIKYRRKKGSYSLLRQYINTHLPLIKSPVKKRSVSLDTEGKVHDLKRIYQEVNQEYFSSDLNLSITWYGQSHKRNGRHMVYGLYNDETKLVKIHRLLDRKQCPEFYLAFVVYHEMLHAVHRPEQRKVKSCIHTPAFRKAEQFFKYYPQAIAWEKKSRHLFFK